MSYSVLGNSYYLGFGIKSSFNAIGGTAPYTYSVALDGVGGTIDSNGVYTAPQKVGIDVIQATDATGKKAVTKVYIGTALHLVCDIIQKGLGLADGRVYIFDQKIFMPTDEGLFVAVSMLSCKPFSSVMEFDAATNAEVLRTNFYASVQIDIISRGTDALFRKEEVIMALKSTYAEQQMTLNSFLIGGLSTGFTNVSNIDGSAIPYRFSITHGLQYQLKKTSGVPYFDQFEEPSVLTNE